MLIRARDHTEDASRSMRRGDIDHHEMPAAPASGEFERVSLTSGNPLLQTSLGFRKENRITALIVALNHPGEDPAPHLENARSLARFAIQELAALSTDLHKLEEDEKPGAFTRLAPRVFDRLGERLFSESKIAIENDALGAELLKVYETRYLEHVPDLGDWLGIVEECRHASAAFHLTYRAALHILDPRDAPSFAARTREAPGLFQHTHGD